jgi:hypothetical protein
MTKIAAGYVQFRLTQGDNLDAAVTAAETKLGIVLSKLQRAFAIKLAQAGMKAALLARNAPPGATVGQLFPGLKPKGGKVSLRFRVRRAYLTREQAEAIDASGQRIKVARVKPRKPGESGPQLYLCLITELLPSLPTVHPSQE